MIGPTLLLIWSLKNYGWGLFVDVQSLAIIRAATTTARSPEGFGTLRGTVIHVSAGRYERMIEDYQ
jgi:hypothetical protein